MKSKDDLTGKFARLPDGQLVRIETVHSDGYASVRRIDGEWTGMIAVCAIDKLESVAVPDPAKLMTSSASTSDPARGQMGRHA